MVARETPPRCRISPPSQLSQVRGRGGTLDGVVEQGQLLGSTLPTQGEPDEPIAELRVVRQAGSVQIRAEHGPLECSLLAVPSVVPVAADDGAKRGEFRIAPQHRQAGVVLETDDPGFHTKGWIRVDDDLPDEPVPSGGCLEIEEVESCHLAPVQKPVTPPQELVSGADP